MSDVPQWWDALVGDESTPAIAWRPRDAWEPADSEDLAGTLRNAATQGLDEQFAAGKLLVGTGPSVTMRGTGIDIETHWYLDPSSPHELWCALGDFYPARLWIPVAPTADALHEVLSASHPKPALDSIALTGFVRGYLGSRHEVGLPNVYSGDMVPLNGLELDRYAAMMSYLEVGSWGSHKREDPLKDDFDVVSPIALLARASNSATKAQELGRIPAMTWRTLHSRSYLSFEIHIQQFVFAAVRYRPSPASHHAVVERLNIGLGMNYPLDLPLDVVGALTCFDFLRDVDLEHILQAPEDDGQLATAIRVFAGLWNGDLGKTLRLREYTRHPSPVIRQKLMQLAAWYDYRFLIEELELTAGSGLAVDHAENLVLFGHRPDNYNAFGDSFDDKPVMVDRAGNPVDVESDFGAESEDCA